MPLPQNWQTIYAFLTSHGYSGNAAAGIEGNIEQESGGNPESVGSGGGGLIGFTPLPAGYVTGNVQRDLQTQLNAILRFNESKGGVGQLNAQPTVRDAAMFYETHFEAPNPSLANTGNRVQSAIDVANAAHGGVPASFGSKGAPGGGGFNLSSIGPDLINSVLGGFGIGSLADLLERAALIILGLLFVIIGIIKLNGKDVSDVAQVAVGGASKGAKSVGAERTNARRESTKALSSAAEPSKRKTYHIGYTPGIGKGPGSESAIRRMESKESLPGDTGKGLMETPEITGAEDINEPVPF